MKRLLAVLLCFILCFGVIGCSSNNSSNSSSSSDSNNQESSVSTIKTTDPAEWKAFLTEYESFVNEYETWVNSYINAANKYNENPDNQLATETYMNIAAQANEWVSKASEFSKKSDEIRSSLQNASADEIKEYTEKATDLSNRITVISTSISSSAQSSSTSSSN